MSNINLIEIGCFVGVHGIKGQVKLNSFTEIPESIFNYKEFFLEKNDNVLKLKLISKVKQNLICKIFKSSPRQLSVIKSPPFFGHL